jgi:hypothetical protein
MPLPSSSLTLAKPIFQGCGQNPAKSGVFTAFQIYPDFSKRQFEYTTVCRAALESI